jgi:hypothetical protein
VLARPIAERAIGELLTPKPEKSQKNPPALGRLGGLKRGKATAEGFHLAEENRSLRRLGLAAASTRLFYIYNWAEFIFVSLQSA